MIATPENIRSTPVVEHPTGLGIRLDRLSKHYDQQPVIDDISLEIRPGECLALLGPNGVGKTTLFKLMLGLVRPSSGAVEIDGQDPATHAFRPVRTDIGFLPENVSFHDAMTGTEVLTFYARLKNVPPSECAMLLDRVGLADAASRRVRTYSKGMRQRLGLAQALLGHPRLLILDEPTTGLDPELRRQFFEILRNFSEAGITIVISSHALTELEAHADRYAILHNGSLAAFGTWNDLQSKTGLPVHIRLTLPPGKVQSVVRLFSERFNVTRSGAGLVDLTCPEDQKMLLVREILDSGIPVTDIEVHSSRLDDIYAHIAAEEESK
jgi:Cu-processing system ATP-binding protein